MDQAEILPFIHPGRPGTFDPSIVPVGLEVSTLATLIGCQ
jgi:hypothetical protein